MGFLGVQVIRVEGRFKVDSPFYPPFRAWAKLKGAKWDSDLRLWEFPNYSESDLRNALKMYYGTDGNEVPLVTLEFWLHPQELESHYDTAYLLGKPAFYWRHVEHGPSRMKVCCGRDFSMFEGLIRFDEQREVFIVQDRTRLHIRNLPISLAGNVVDLFHGNAQIISEGDDETRNPLFRFTDREIWAEVLRRELVDESDPDEGLETEESLADDLMSEEADHLNPGDPAIRELFDEIAQVIDSGMTRPRPDAVVREERNRFFQ